MLSLFHFFIFYLKFEKICSKSSLIGFKTYCLCGSFYIFQGYLAFFLKSSILKILYPVSLNSINSLYSNLEYLLLEEAKFLIGID